MWNVFIVELICYVVMWFTVPVASSARQKLEMRGEKITAQSIKENTSTAADARERSIIAKIVGAIGTILLIFLKFLALLILIGLVVCCSLLGMVALSAVPMFGFEFYTGLALISFFFVAILPIVVLIYLAIMFLLSHRPKGLILLTVLMLWIVALVTMTISAIKSPSTFGNSVKNAFEAVFDHNQRKLYDEFEEEDVEKYIKSGKFEFEIKDSMEATKSTSYSTKHGLISSHYSKGMMIVFCGEQHSVKAAKESLLMDQQSKNISFRSMRGTAVTLSPKELATESLNVEVLKEQISESAAAYAFKVDGDLKVYCVIGEQVKDLADKELIEEVFGVAGDAFNLTGEAFNLVGEVVKAVGTAIGSASNGISIQGSVNYQRPKNTAIYKDILAQAKLSEPNKGATTATKTGTEAWATNPKVYHYPVKGKIVKGYSHDGVYILFYGSEKDVDCCIRHFAIDQNGYVQTTTRKGNKFLITKYGIKSLFESSKNKVVEIERYAEVRAESEFGERNLLMGTFDDVEYRYLKGPSDSPVMKEEIAKILETSYVQNIFPQKNV
ncbi:MAG: hypothetical protein IKL17_01410, partial [Alistipes sp.]|nr:hypothetical protein [Alistipes sp.]